MDFLNDLGKKLSETAKTVTKKSEELVEITKLNLAIGSDEDKIKKLFAEMGEELYRQYIVGKSFGEEFDLRCQNIKSLELNIEETKKKIQALKGTRICPACSASVDTEVSFCPACGKKLEPMVTEEVKEEE